MKNDKGLNCFISGCSDKELKYFLNKYDALSKKYQKLVLNKIDLSNRTRIINL